MKYALFTFETTSESERKVSWEIIPDDRSKTLLKAIGFSPMASIENSKDNFQVVEDSQVNHINSPLPNWVDLLEKKVSVRILEDAHFMDYCFVLDHISWDPKSNMAEVGSKGLTLKAPPGNLTVKLL